jgi:hypothetical protein
MLFKLASLFRKLANSPTNELISKLINSKGFKSLSQQLQSQLKQLNENTSISILESLKDNLEIISSPDISLFSNLEKLISLKSSLTDEVSEDQYEESAVNEYSSFEPYLNEDYGTIVISNIKDALHFLSKHSPSDFFTHLQNNIQQFIELIDYIKEGNDSLSELNSLVLKITSEFDNIILLLKDIDEESDYVYLLGDAFGAIEEFLDQNVSDAKKVYEAKRQFEGLTTKDDGSQDESGQSMFEEDKLFKQRSFSQDEIAAYQKAKKKEQLEDLKRFAPTKALSDKQKEYQSIKKQLETKKDSALKQIPTLLENSDKSSPEYKDFLSMYNKYIESPNDFRVERIDSKIVNMLINENPKKAIIESAKGLIKFLSAFYKLKNKSKRSAKVVKNMEFENKKNQLLFRLRKSINDGKFKLDQLYLDKLADSYDLATYKKALESIRHQLTKQNISLDELNIAPKVKPQGWEKEKAEYKTILESLGNEQLLNELNQIVDKNALAQFYNRNRSLLEVKPSRLPKPKPAPAPAPATALTSEPAKVIRRRVAPN